MTLKPPTDGSTPAWQAVNGLSPTGIPAVDTPAVQALIDGGGGYLDSGTFIVTGLLIASNVSLSGTGGTTIKLADDSDTDLITVADFAGLVTGNADNGAIGWSLNDLTLDGNGSNQNSTSWTLRVYGHNYRVDNVEIVNGRDGNVYSTSGTLLTAVSMESKWTRTKIRQPTGSGAINVDWRGPHDSTFTDVEVVAGTSDLLQTGIRTRGNAGAETFTGVHVWGYHDVGWYLEKSCQAANCQAEGALTNVKPAAEYISWHGTIFGTSGYRSNEIGLMLQGTSRGDFDVHFRAFDNATGSYPVSFGTGTGGKNLINGIVSGYGAHTVTTGTASAVDQVTLFNGDSVQNSYILWSGQSGIQVNSGNAFLIRKPISNGQRFNWDTNNSIAQHFFGALTEWSTDLGVTVVARVSGTDGSVQPGTTAGLGPKHFGGAGAPGSITGVANGDFYFRSDGGSLTTIYQRRAGAWVGIV